MSVKAFELIPVVESIGMGEQSKVEIECMECCGKNLYLGTNSCLVLHFLVEEKMRENGPVSCRCQRQGSKSLGLKKPVMLLKAASALNRILALCDSQIYFLSMFDLEIQMPAGSKLRAITNFCINENPMTNNPFSIQICCSTRKKVLQLYTVTEEKVTHTREITLSESVISLAMDGKFVCAATPSQYLIASSDTDNIQQLFPIDMDHVTPLVKRVGKEEFLLSGPSALGMFATAGGVSQRPPVQWNDNLISFCLSHPYVLALSDEFISVHSILDQKQKQTIMFSGGKLLGQFEGRIYVSCGRRVYLVKSVPWHKQVQNLMSEKLVDEALQLARNTHNLAGLSREKFISIYKRLQQQGGFVEFERKEWRRAEELFVAGKVDVRELICLYSDLTPETWNFTRSVPLLHTIANVDQLTSYKEAREFLRNFLEKIRGTDMAIGCLEEIDTALLKLYVKEDDSNVTKFICLPDFSCNHQESVKFLEKFEHFHAIATLQKSRGDEKRALELWRRLACGELSDESFPGFEFLVEQLACTNCHDVVWEQAGWVLTHDQVQGVKIFTTRPPDETVSERMRPDAIVEYLGRYQLALRIYLEFLVYEKNLAKEKYHTQLALLYFDILQKLRREDDGWQEIRGSLQKFLRHSSLYRPHVILGKTTDAGLLEECAILYGKLEEHDKALNILVHELKDYDAAEAYCVDQAEMRDKTHKKQIFQTLLSVFLDQNKKRMVGPAISLLNNSCAEFDAKKVLELVPEDWSVAVMARFLLKSLRTSMTDARTKKMEKSLAKGLHLQRKAEKVQTGRQSVFLTEDRTCDVCGRHFLDVAFARYPNGIITHIECAKQLNVCPVSGRLF